MRERLPLVLSATAVFIAVLGSTSLGQAAGNAVGQTVDKAKATAGFGPAALRLAGDLVDHGETRPAWLSRATGR